MTRQQLLLKLERLEANAHRLLDDAAALKEELSGGSDSSNQALSLSQINRVIAKRQKRKLKS